jgi:hypothetical protein
MRDPLGTDSHCVAVQAIGQLCCRWPGEDLGFSDYKESADNRWLFEYNEYPDK